MPPTILTEHSLAYVFLNSKEIELAQNLITKLNKEATKVELHLNANKTELMAFSFTNTVELKTEQCGKLQIPWFIYYQYRERFWYQ